MHQHPSTDVETDTETLVQRYQDGDSTALEALYRRYYTPVLRMVRGRVQGSHNQEHVEEIVSETWVKVASRLHTFEQRPGTAGFVGWLYTIAGNLIKDHYRTVARARETLIDDMRVFDQVTAGDVSDQIRDREAFTAAVRGLSAKEVAVVTLRFYADLSVEETGAHLGIAPGAVKQRQHRAVSRLRGTVNDRALSTAVKL